MAIIKTTGSKGSAKDNLVKNEPIVKFEAITITSKVAKQIIWRGLSQEMVDGIESGKMEIIGWLRTDAFVDKDKQLGKPGVVFLLQVGRSGYVLIPFDQIKDVFGIDYNEHEFPQVFVK